ncbi:MULTISPECIES: phage shock protein PspD [Tatumella]|uniref:Phage shock protein PspD n=1 Tax=Tatumella punctata TaxID=399969 RepID=A0ABW1VHU3_9GAMM|nr:MULTISPECIES: phage shock protein PspD [unclassified Tatumella]MBS0856497.1 phage shock protein D [Tatumella sp. JGM16]MBS0876235.1 phage shock protein D [Tatumella sp. JGM82]MBS0889284.1 phage shock protein D [Tatumella sp. JGM94]MBS0893628.1 phage shock protein D [Tatumella sp. JGM130]MBS0902302.1 phage shock protein D [Tatumella sp. JGM100]
MKYAEQQGRPSRLMSVLLSAVKFIIITILSRTPAGISARVLNRVARRPVRIILAMVLEPVLSAIMKKISARLFREKHEQTAK